MAGSLYHIIDPDGSFSMDLIEHLGDAHEALEECFHIILFLCEGDMRLVSEACNRLGFPDPFDPNMDSPRAPMCKTSSYRR